MKNAFQIKIELEWFEPKTATKTAEIASDKEELEIISELTGREILDKVKDFIEYGM